MNYIIHLNAFLEKAAKEKWMVPYHYSLYIALFATWNKLGFRKIFNIRRDETMAAAKIKAKSTYYRALKDLDAHEYLVYYPSTQRQSPATIAMIPFDGRTMPSKEPKNMKMENAMVSLDGPLLKTNIKLISNDVSNSLPNLEEVLKFFSTNQYAREEALKFWYHHEATSWLTGNTPVQHWQPLAHKWMLNISKTNNDNNENYDQPF